MCCAPQDAASFKSVLDNYTVLQKLWDISKDQASDPSMKARIIGVETQFKTYRTYFGIQLGYLLLQHSDNLSKTLQSNTLYAAAGQRIAAMTVNTLQSIRNDECFDMFWQKIERARQPLDVEAPRLPRKHGKLRSDMMMEGLSQNFLKILSHFIGNSIMKLWT